MEAALMNGAAFFFIRKCVTIIKVLIDTKFTK